MGKPPHQCIGVGVKREKDFLGFKDKKKNNKISHFPNFPLFPYLH